MDASLCGDQLRPLQGTRDGIPCDIMCATRFPNRAITGINDRGNVHVAIDDRRGGNEGAEQSKEEDDRSGEERRVEEHYEDELET